MLTKTCTKCKKEFDLENFYKSKDCKYGRISTCKPCYREHNKLWRQNGAQKRINERSAELRKLEKNKKQAQERSQRYISDHREYIYQYLLGKYCIDCGTGDIRILEFDHVFGKKLFGIAMTHGRKKSSVDEEIEKCVIRCSNCHCIKTLRERKAFRYRRYTSDIENNLLPEQNMTPYRKDWTEESLKKLLE